MKDISYMIVPGLGSGRTSQEIINNVCEKLNITNEEIKSKCRKRHIVEARSVALYLIRKKTDLSLKRIGLLFNCNHATVLQAVRKIDEWLIYDKAFKEKVKYII